MPFSMEYPAPETFARGLAPSAPVYEAIQHIGEDEFLARTNELAAAHVCEGLPLRGELQLYGFVGTKQ